MTTYQGYAKGVRLLGMPKGAAAGRRSGVNDDIKKALRAYVQARHEAQQKQQRIAAKGDEHISQAYATLREGVADKQKLADAREDINIRTGGSYFGGPSREVIYGADAARGEVPTARASYPGLDETKRQIGHAAPPPLTLQQILERMRETSTSADTPNTRARE